MIKSFHNLPIRVKAFAASVVLLICLVAIGTDACFTLQQSARNLKVLSDVNLPKQDTVTKLKDDVTEIDVKVFRYVTWASNGVNRILLQPLSSEIRGELDGVRERLRLIAARRDLSSAERSRVTDLFAKWDKYARSARDTLDIGSTDAPMATMMLGATDDDYQKISADLNKISGLVAQQTRAETRKLSAAAEQNREFLTAGGLAGVLISIIVTLVVAGSIVRPIQFVTKAMQKISAGNTDFDLGYKDRSDEVGQMVKAIVAFRQNLERQNLRFDAALNNMSQGLCMFDAAARIVVYNDRYVEMLGLPADQVKPGCTLGDVLRRLVAAGSVRGDQEAYLAELLAAIADGRPANSFRTFNDGREIYISNQPMPGGGWVATHEDVTERRRAEAQIVHLAHHDALTDLPNRVLMYERLEHALAHVRRGESIAVLLLDLDCFKNVNDTFGHGVGDLLLQAVAGRLRGCVREIDTIARLGGDEFAIIQASVEQPVDAAALARRLREAVGAPYVLNDHAVVIDTSIGIAVAPGDGVDAEALLKAADMAAYAAKADGRGTYRFFEAQMDACFKARRILELDLRQAFANGEFELHFQPLVNLQTGTISSFEALMRWQHPERGMIPPSEFIPVAEEIGLIVPLGEWALRMACAAAATWPEEIKVAVNLSPAQFAGKNLVQAVMNALAASGLAAHRLELEITESVLMQNTPTILATLHQLHATGVRFSMDDFGTGYSSLSYLRIFPFDKIKVDRSFIGDLTDRDDSLAIVRAVAALASALKMTTTAEGVETQQQLDQVRALGITEMQGYLFSRPKCIAEITQLLADAGDGERPFRPAAIGASDDHAHGRVLETASQPA
ncbi:MAG TPA: EAL domain-containing protein [Stellaceae bacterium]|nr:EAL domain-containing protein [Stellaceae bacterium]